MKTEKEIFFDNYIKDVKIKIADRYQCKRFQEIAFEFGVRLHSCMHEEIQESMAYNIADILPEYKGRSFATDMDNLVVYDNGTRLQKSGFYNLETDKKEISFDAFIAAYELLTPITK